MVQYFKPGEGVVCRLYAFKECSIDVRAEALFQIIHDWKKILQKILSASFRTVLQSWVVNTILSFLDWIIHIQTFGISTALIMAYI